MGIVPLSVRKNSVLYKATYFILEAIILRVKFFWVERCNQFSIQMLNSWSKCCIE